MKHDELLKVIDGLLHLGPAAQALRAVVEKHKPVEYQIGVSIDLSYRQIETYCSCSKTFNDYDKIFYPCFTVQAIEKELK